MTAASHALEDIRRRITLLSGGGKNLSSHARQNGIYGSFTLPGLEDIRAVRDTRQRHADFGVPEDLTGRTVIDLGANVGAMLFEFARRGAVVTGVEFRQDRVDLMRDVARYYSEHSAECHRTAVETGEALWEWQCAPGCLASALSGAEFYQANFNDVREPKQSIEWVWTMISSATSLGEQTPTWLSRKYDVVLCSAVDRYLDDPDQMYRMLRHLTKEPDGTLYFECNRRSGGYPTEYTIQNLRTAGFTRVRHLGVGSCPFIRRKIFEARP